MVLISSILILFWYILILSSILVHGRQGEKGPQKAYACANPMEFFAELSVAFHYQKDETIEYNKWFPFNHKQLHQYDRETCELLEKLWNQNESL